MIHVIERLLTWVAFVLAACALSVLFVMQVHQLRSERRVVKCADVLLASPLVESNAVMRTSSCAGLTPDERFRAVSRAAVLSGTG